MLSTVPLALGIILAQPKTTPTQAWQARYDTLVASMRKRDVKAVIKWFHRDYTETANGVIYGLEHVRKQLPARCETFARLNLRPKVVGVKVLGYTASITLDANYTLTRKESGRKAVYVSKTRLLDTWVKNGAQFQLYRSAVQSSSLTRNGKVVKRPAKSQ